MTQKVFAVALLPHILCANCKLMPVTAWRETCLSKYPELQGFKRAACRLNLDPELFIFFHGVEKLYWFIYHINFTYKFELTALLGILENVAA